MLAPWVVQCDGAWCHKGVGISAVVTSPTGIVIRYAVRFIFANDEHSTNNTTEYEALLHHQDRFQSYSGTYRKRERSKKSFFDEVPRDGQGNGRHFKGYSVQHIPRDNNNEAEKLAKATAKNQAMPPDVFFKIIKEPFIKETKPKIVNIVETPDWRAEIMEYLTGSLRTTR
jgi:hypothetical protein